MAEEDQPRGVLSCATQPMPRGVKTIPGIRPLALTLAFIAALAGFILLPRIATNEPLATSLDGAAIVLLA